jgi:hypothetical protein
MLKKKLTDNKQLLAPNFKFRRNQTALIAEDTEIPLTHSSALIMNCGSDARRGVTSTNSNTNLLQENSLRQVIEVTDTG